MGIRGKTDEWDTTRGINLIIPIKKGTHQVLMVQKSAKFKKSWSKKKAKAEGSEMVTSAAAPKSGPDSKTICYHCKETGHWKRNCSKWLVEHGKKAGMLLQAKVHLLHML